MAFINWGEETPEQLKARKEMEERMMFEQMAYSAATAAAAAASAGAAGGGGQIKPSEFVGQVNWLVVAPAGEGSEGHDFENFDNWATATFSSIYNVRRVRIESGAANAHVHGDLQYSDLALQLHNKLLNQWVTVWSKRLTNPNYPNDDSGDFLVNHIDRTFEVIPEVDAIRFTSNPGSDQTYHNWGDDDTIFKFYA